MKNTEEVITVMKHNPMVTANAAAATTAIVYIFCRIAFTLVPDMTMLIARSWFHGIDISKISALNLSLESFVLGLVTATVGAWVAGYVFAYLYNAFITKQ